MEDTNSISANWVRSAVNSIVAREGGVPQAEIEKYFKDKEHSSLGRLMAFELLTRDNEDLAKQMIPKFIDDPSLPLRHKAVAALIKEANDVAETDKVMALGKLTYAFNNARDIGQLETISKKLSEMGVSVDLRTQMGFISKWKLVGSFDNKDMKGYDVAYGPEEAIGMIDVAATYTDFDGKETKWIDVATDHETGVVDLNSIIGKVKGVSLYALGNFPAEQARTAELRIGTPNATKIWLNGELVMSNEIYHNSNSIDKFTGKVNLKEGGNQILIKVCQNEQEEPWAQSWSFQLRICDESGKAITPAKPKEGNY